MPQGVTRSNRVLKNISKDQDLFYATREFCTILSHRQRVKMKSRSSKSFPEISLSLRNCKPASQLWKGHCPPQWYSDYKCCCQMQQRYLVQAHETAAVEQTQAPKSKCFYWTNYSKKFKTLTPPLIFWNWESFHSPPKKILDGDSQHGDIRTYKFYTWPCDYVWTSILYVNIYINVCMHVYVYVYMYMYVMHI